MVTKQINILWQRVMVIAAIQAAITLMWIVYRAYLGRLLGNWGFSEDFTAQLLAVEVCLAVVMEPLFGALSDRQQRFLGSRLPLISLGVILAAAIFIGLPILGVFQLPVRWLLPMVAIAWALAMTMFRTPVYVLLLKSTPSRTELPLALSVLTLVIGVMDLLKPSLQNGLLAVGAFPAFLIGSVTLLTASLGLGRILPSPAVPPEAETPSPSPLPWLGFLQTILMAIAFTWGSAIVLQRWLGLFGSMPLTLGLTVGQGLSLLVTTLAIPVGWLALRWRRYPLLGVAFGWLTVILLLLLGIPTQDGGYVVIAVLWAWAIATVRNGTLPYIFDTIPGDWAGLGIGVFFGVSGLAGLVLSQWIPSEAQLLRSFMGVLCLAIATVLALISHSKSHTTSRV
ncbi:MAG: MFS transporter [Synechococcus sp.]|nr:MFS transporter [Synechococcus sp.]